MRTTSLFLRTFLFASIIAACNGLNTLNCNDQEVAYQQSAKNGDIGGMRAAVNTKKVYKNACCNQHDTALMEAAKEGSENAVKWILDNTLDDIDAQNKDGWTALMFAARDNRYRVARLLRERGADINKEDNYGRTALWLAAYNCRYYTHTCGYLGLRPTKQELNYQNRYGVTALMGAATHSDHVSEGPRLKRMKELKDMGADISLTNNKGETALDIFCSQASPESGLMAAVMLSDISSVRELVQEVQDINKLIKMSDYDDRTVLMEAVRIGNITIVDLLLKEGANANISNSRGWTALMEAAKYERRKNAMSSLIRYGARLNDRNHNNDTALSIAREYENKQAIKLLREKGAEEDCPRSCLQHAPFCIRGVCSLLGCLAGL